MYYFVVNEIPFSQLRKGGIVEKKGTKGLKIKEWKEKRNEGKEKGKNIVLNRLEKERKGKGKEEERKKII